MSTDILELKRQKLALLEQRRELERGLPHLYGFPHYKWSREFYDSTAKVNLLSAANQIGKSSTAIRRCIRMCTEPTWWPELWPKREPLQIWYLYPSMPVADLEWSLKWEREFMPRGKFKDDPVFGWKEEYKENKISAVHFKSGVSLIFKAYSQNAKDLQTGTCDAIFTDEECPEEIVDELFSRLNATDGYFHMVATPTLGQAFWQELIEGGGRSEKFPDLRVWQVSLYDCIQYEDGSPGAYTIERINRIKARCRNDSEVQRRVYGKFIVDTGRTFPGFTRAINVKPAHPLPANWLIFAGIDYGSGSSRGGHPSAIVFVAVSPDMRQGRVIKGWRGDGVETTAGDVVLKYQEMKAGLNVTAAYYDWQCKDLETIAMRLNESVMPADKARDKGEQIINVLFKNEMLVIYDQPELRPLMQELQTLLKSTVKEKAKDDFADALRYAVSRVAWDWSAIKGDLPQTPHEPEARGLERLRKGEDIADPMAQETLGIEQEMEFWNGQYEF